MIDSDGIVIREGLAQEKIEPIRSGKIGSRREIRSRQDVFQVVHYQGVYFASRNYIVGEWSPGRRGPTGRRCWIEEMHLVRGSGEKERVGKDPLKFVGRRHSSVGKRFLIECEPLVSKEEEGLVVSVVDLWYVYGAAHNSPVLILMIWGKCDPWGVANRIAGREFVVPVEVPRAIA